MRVITGSARGRRLETLPGDATRPTGEKVKESLFSAIQFDIEGRRVLDLFAGSGQLGIEALSRGASGCVFVDKNTEAVKIIKQNLQHTGLMEKAQVLGTDAMSYLTRPGDRFDLVFLDPPYASELLVPVLEKVEPLVNDGGILVCETDDTVALPERFGRFAVAKTYRFGRIYVWVYRYDLGEEDSQ